MQKVFYKDFKMCYYKIIKFKYLIKEKKWILLLTLQQNQF